jgi:hypothetical protein
VTLSGQSAGTAIDDPGALLTITDDDLPPAPPPPPAPPLPNVAPVITNLRVVPNRFLARVGASLRFTLSEAARVRLSFLRARPGRRVGRRCGAPTRRNRRARRCRRFARFTVVTRNATAGANAFRIGRVLGGRRLRPGRYRVQARATDAGGLRSRSVETAFRVRRARRRP